MRVLVAVDAWGRWSSAQVGTAVARAWARLGAEVALVPVASAGAGFTRAWADLRHARLDHEVVAGTSVGVVEDPATCLLAPELAVADPVGHGDHAPDPRRWEVSSRVLADILGRRVWGGASLGSTAGEPGREVLLELVDAPWRDGGAGWVEAWDDARDPVASRGPGSGGGGRLTLVTSAEQAGAQCTGLRGIVSLEGRAEGMDPAKMLALDERLVVLAERLTGDRQAGTVPGSGACGGLGLAVQALGGRVVTGPEALLECAGARDSVRRADLVVTGCEHFDFGSMGGEVVSEVTALAGEAGVPVVAVCSTAEVASRELREHGIEAAQPVGSPPHRDGHAHGRDPDAFMAWLDEACLPVARTWTW